MMGWPAVGRGGAVVAVAVGLGSAGDRAERGQQEEEEDHVAHGPPMLHGPRRGVKTPLVLGHDQHQQMIGSTP